MYYEFTQLTLNNKTYRPCKNRKRITTGLLFALICSGPEYRIIQILKIYIVSLLWVGVLKEGLLQHGFTKSFVSFEAWQFTIPIRSCMICMDFLYFQMYLYKLHTSWTLATDVNMTTNTLNINMSRKQVETMILSSCNSLETADQFEESYII